MKPNFIKKHPSNNTPIIGNNCWFGNSVSIDTTGKITIGNNCIISHNAKILTHSHQNLTKDLPDLLGKFIPEEIVIGNNVFIGEGAVIMPQTKSIGNKAVIGAYSVVTKPIGDKEIWAGNPAKFIKKRSNQEK